MERRCVYKNFLQDTFLLKSIKIYLQRNALTSIYSKTFKKRQAKRFFTADSTFLWLPPFYEEVFGSIELGILAEIIKES